jgi:hypothetical protein
MSGTKIALLIVGVVLALIGFGVTAAGAGLMWAHSTQRDADGYLESPTWDLQTDTYALTTEDIDLAVASAEEWLWLRELEVRVDIDPTSEAPVFVGVGPRDEVESYLADVAQARVVNLGGDRDDVTYRTTGFDPPPSAPAEQGFWTAQAEGSGPQQLAWEAEPGTWSAVVMNADASAGVAIAASGAVEADFLLPLGAALLAGGLVLLAIAATLILVAAVGSARRQTARAPEGAAAGAAAGRPYPLVIEGRLDPPLSRWLWLVKWLLLIPHFVVLAFLWLAFSVATVIAGFAILFTGRYPRGLFDFNVGVMRWTWRVVFYGYSALGTDRYPPFTLEAVDYPATLDVAYPERLSRGLVLVKWWLLAIPHYIIVGLLVGGGLTWTTNRDAWGSWTVGGGAGLIGVLVFVVGVLLLFTARYPQGLFDLVMGLDRWAYRVLAYAALMTDEYPPFRLDPGGQEPAAVPQPPAGPAPTGSEAELVPH